MKRQMRLSHATLLPKLIANSFFVILSTSFLWPFILRGNTKLQDSILFSGSYCRHMTSGPPRFPHKVLVLDIHEMLHSLQCLGKGKRAVFCSHQVPMVSCLMFSGLFQSLALPHSTLSQEEVWVRVKLLAIGVVDRALPEPIFRTISSKSPSISDKLSRVLGNLLQPQIDPFVMLFLPSKVEDRFPTFPWNLLRFQFGINTNPFINPILV